MGIEIYLHVFEACGVEPPRKCIWINDNQCVEDMDEAKEAAIDTIRTCKDAARPESSHDLLQKLILQLR